MGDKVAAASWFRGGVELCGARILDLKLGVTETFLGEEVVGHRLGERTLGFVLFAFPQLADALKPKPERGTTLHVHDVRPVARTLKPN